MRDGRKLAFLVVLAALLLTGLAACGDGDSADSTAATTRSSGADPGGPSSGSSGNSGAGSTVGSGGDSSAPEGSAGFRTPGGDNSVQNFGEEADAAELEEAGAVLAAYMRARAEDAWVKECEYLAKVARSPLEQLAAQSPQLKGKSCGAILSALSSSAPTSTRASTFGDGIASLRVEGDRGFALYHGNDGSDYFMQMAKEDGEWKVASIAPIAFP